MAAPGSGLALGTLLALALLYKDVDVSAASDFSLPYLVRLTFSTSCCTWYDMKTKSTHRIREGGAREVRYATFRVV